MMTSLYKYTSATAATTEHNAQDNDIIPIYGKQTFISPLYSFATPFYAAASATSAHTTLWKDGDDSEAQGAPLYVYCKWFYWTSSALPTAKG